MPVFSCSACVLYCAAALPALLLSPGHARAAGIFLNPGEGSRTPPVSPTALSAEELLASSPSGTFAVERAFASADLASGVLKVRTNAGGPTSAGQQATSRLFDTIAVTAAPGVTGPALWSISLDMFATYDASSTTGER